MSQYKTGTVAVTNGSQVVTGTGTAFGPLVGMTTGDIFTIVGSSVTYEVGSIDSTTQITLTANYAGVTASGQSYTIGTSFTPLNQIPYFEEGDIETATITKRAMLVIDTLAATLSYGFLSVIDRDLTAPPGSPTEGDTYIVAATATGDWSTHETEIATYTSSAWVFTTPDEGWKAFVVDEGLTVTFISSAWTSNLSVSDLTVVNINGVAAATAQFTTALSANITTNNAKITANSTNVLAALTGQEVVATGFTGTLDGALGGGTPAAATVTALTASGTAFIGDTSNANSTLGLTINQAANSDEIFSLKSSSIAHGMTTQTETDTFCYIKKQGGADGGVVFRGLSDASSSATIPAIRLQGTKAGTIDTTSTTSSRGVVILMGEQSNGGTGTTAMGATQNIFTMENRGTTTWIMKGNGDIHQIGGGYTMSSLAGTGTRNVVVDVNGVMSAP